jgi:hypothetical protein
MIFWCGRTRAPNPLGVRDIFPRERVRALRGSSPQICPSPAAPMVKSLKSPRSTVGDDREDEDGAATSLRPPARAMATAEDQALARWPPQRVSPCGALLSNAVWTCTTAG